MLNLSKKILSDYTIDEIEKIITEIGNQEMVLKILTKGTEKPGAFYCKKMNPCRQEVAIPEGTHMRPDTHSMDYQRIPIAKGLSHDRDYGFLVCDGFPGYNFYCHVDAAGGVWYKRGATAKKIIFETYFLEELSNFVLRIKYVEFQ